MEVGPEYFYQRISAMLNVDCHWYRSSVLESSLTSISYLYMDCFKPLTTAPLKYTLGDVSAHVEALKTDGDISDALTLKWKSLALLGFEYEVVAGIALFKETSFSIHIIEQAHASGSLLMRRHPMLETGSLVCRMTVHNCRVLFSHCLFEKQLSHLESLIDRITNQMGNVHRTGAKQMYLKALIEEVKSNRFPGGSADFGVRRSIFKEHSKHFDELGPGQVAALRLRASAFNTKKINNLSECREHVVAQMNLLKARRQEQLKHGKINHMDSVRFCSADYIKFAELWPQYEANDCHARLLRPPNGLPASLKLQLDGIQAAATVGKPARPAWLGMMVSHRDAFSGCGFYSDSVHPSRDVIFKLLLSIGQPQRLVFLECRKKPLGLSTMTAYGRYEYEAFRFVDHSRVPWVEAADVWVIPTVMVHASEVHTFGEPCSWNIFTRHLKQAPFSSNAHGAGHSGARKNT